MIEKYIRIVGSAIWVGFTCAIEKPAEKTTIANHAE